MVIGIVGQKGSGKDTLADYLVARYRFTKRAFADPIKKVCTEAFLFTEDQLYGDNKEDIDPRWGISPRTAMQMFGTDMARERLGPDHWIKHMRQWINNRKERAMYLQYDDSNDCLVISDVRFQNEAEFVRTFPKNVLIRVTRQNHQNPVDSHVSEQENQEITADITLSNDGSFDELFEKFDQLDLGGV
ncbi:unnamed protein product [Phaeothamnion confervicola]